MSKENAGGPRWWQGTRGEWYLIVQLSLIGLVLFGPQGKVGGAIWIGAPARVTVPVGATLILIGALFSGAAALALGRNLTPLPKPKEDARLVQRGAYRLVRHPIYTGVILLAYGWSLWVHSWCTVGYATILFLVLDLKSRREERWLMEKYPEYGAYRQRVRRLIPFLY